MKRKFYLDIAVLIVILGGFGGFVFMQQHTPATEAQTQEAAEQMAAGCCGAATVEGETPKSTPGGCCGTSADEIAQSEDVSQHHSKCRPKMCQKQAHKHRKAKIRKT